MLHRAHRKSCKRLEVNIDRPLTGAVSFLRPNKAHFPALWADDYLIPYTHRRTQRGGRAASR